jgi:hypothetical protein
MAGTPVKNAGIIMLIGAAPGASPTVPIGGLSDIPEFGNERKALDVTDLSQHWRRYLKGLKDGGKISLAGQFRGDDIGQKLLWQAANSEASWFFSVQLPDTKGANGSTYLFLAQVLSTKVMPGKVDGLVEFKCDLQIDQSVTLTPAA